RITGTKILLFTQISHKKCTKKAKKQLFFKKSEFFCSKYLVYKEKVVNLQAVFVLNGGNSGRKDKYDPHN
ncbi:MAG: hypothetical protein IJP45_01725, partial [Paludibacteraceae bacterium]|nr:hypothetical protein [Paludibacteraceae bacterium]MBQ6763886.1 hypothetical protein [Paludibacteraceae bacterium]